MNVSKKITLDFLRPVSRLLALMNTDRYIALDIETGGIGLQYSLLTAAFIVTDFDGKILDELEFSLSNDQRGQEGDYYICANAMTVNKIDIIAHSKKAIPYKKAGTSLYNFLKKWSNDGAIKLIPVGHGIVGDIRQIQDKLISRGSWETYCSYRNMDTSSVIQFLRACNVFPDEVSGSLTSVANYFGIQFGDAAHTATGDALVTLQVFLKLREMLKKNYAVSN